MKIIKNIKKITVLNLLIIIAPAVFCSSQHNFFTVEKALSAKNERIDFFFTENQILTKKRSIMEVYELLGVDYTLKTKWEDIETAYKTILHSTEETKEKRKKVLETFSLLENNRYLLRSFILDYREDSFGGGDGTSRKCLSLESKGFQLESCYQLLDLDYSPKTTWLDIENAYISKMESRDITIEKQKELKKVIRYLESFKKRFFLPFQNQESKEKKDLISLILSGSFTQAEEFIYSDKSKNLSDKDKLDIIKIMLHSVQNTNPISSAGKKDTFSYPYGEFEIVKDLKMYQERYKNILRYLCNSLSGLLDDSKFSIEEKDLDKIFELILLDKSFLFFGLQAIKLIKDKRFLYQERTLNQTDYNPNGNVVKYLDYCFKNTPKDDQYLNQLLDKLKQYIALG